MQISMIIKELPKDAFEKVESNQEITISGVITSWHKDDDGIGKVIYKLDKCEEILWNIKKYGYDDDKMLPIIEELLND